MSLRYFSLLDDNSPAIDQEEFESQIRRINSQVSKLGLQWMSSDFDRVTLMTIDDSKGRGRQYTIVTPSILNSLLDLLEGIDI